jgi:hypothetical protein
LENAGRTFSRKGNPTPRYSDEDLEFIDKAIEEHYETFKQKNVWQTYLKVLDVVWDNGWLNVDSQLSQNKVNYFLEEVQPGLHRKNSSPAIKRETLLK